VFSALASHNHFPARYLPEPAFNQLVLKALFLEVPLEHLLGLAGRIGPELRRMAEGYASERRAAGRPVPKDIALVVSAGPG
jgi:hypothetical protein